MEGKDIQKLMRELSQLPSFETALLTAVYFKYGSEITFRTLPLGVSEFFEKCEKEGLIQIENNKIILKKGKLLFLPKQKDYSIPEKYLALIENYLEFLLKNNYSGMHRWVSNNLQYPTEPYKLAVYFKVIEAVVYEKTRTNEKPTAKDVKNAKMFMGEIEEDYTSLFFEFFLNWSEIAPRDWQEETLQTLRYKHKYFKSELKKQRQKLDW